MKKVILIFLMTSFLVACGPARLEKPNTDLPSLIELIKLDSGNKVLKIRLTHRQAKPRDASNLACELALEDEDLSTLTAIDLPELTAYAREVLDLNLPQKLTIPTQQRLSYRMVCTLTSPKSRDERVISRGTLYRLSNQTPPVYR